MKPSIFIANWKMNKSYREALAWCQDYHDELSELALKTTLALCPDFTVLAGIKELLKNTKVKLGAQNCAAHLQGPYTGEVSVTSLVDIGCSFCIIGHSERRFFAEESPKALQQKLQLLITHTINPIFCIGETLAEKEASLTQQILAEQLNPLVDAITALAITPSVTFYVAYEPIWSIGTGSVPPQADLIKTKTWLNQYISSACNSPIDYKILYGGSVSDTTKSQVAFFDGFLIGGSSLDFQELKKVVELGI